MANKKGITRNILIALALLINLMSCGYLYVNNINSTGGTSPVTWQEDMTPSSSPPADSIARVVDSTRIANSIPTNLNIDSAAIVEPNIEQPQVKKSDEPVDIKDGEYISEPEPPENKKETYDDGSYYIGQFNEDGKREGKGTYYFKNGDIYKGGWKENEQEGSGKMTFDDGTYYDGHWVKGDKNGKGTYKFDNGSFYIGNWVNDNREGFGKLYYRDGKLEYEGMWVNDTMSDENAVYYFKNGDTYKGSIRTINDNYVGSGKIFYRDGTISNAHWEGSTCTPDN